MTTTKNGHQVSFDVGFESYGGYRRTASEILELSSLVKISEPVFMKHIGAKNQEGIRLWWKKYPENKYLLVTRGKNGLYGFATIKSERRTFELESIPCEHPRDSAGAGDVLMAMSIHNLLLKGPPSDEDNLHRSLGHGQALASLSCSLYGARALQFVFLNQGLSPDEIMDWADRILLAGKSGNSLLPLIGLRDRDRFNNPSRLASFRTCPVCGTPFSGTTSQNKKEIKLNRPSLDFVPWCMIEGFSVGKSYRSRLRDLKNGPTLFVGREVLSVPPCSVNSCFCECSE